MGRRPIDQPRGGQWPGGRGGTSRAQGHTCGGGGVPGSPSWSWPPYCPRPPRKGQLPCRANQPPSTQQGCLLGRGQGLSGTLPLCSVLGSAVPAPPPAVNHAQWGNRGPLLGPPNTRRGGRVSLGRSQPSRKPAPTTLTGVLSSGHLRTWPSPADCALYHQASFQLPLWPPGTVSPSPLSAPHPLQHRQLSGSQKVSHRACSEPRPPARERCG